MYLHGHESNVAAFGRNKLWFAVGMCQRRGGSRGGAYRPRILAEAAGVAAVVAAGDNKMKYDIGPD